MDVSSSVRRSADSSVLERLLLVAVGLAVRTSEMLLFGHDAIVAM